MDPRVWIDSLLELTVVGSFSKLGYAVRRRLFGWSSPPPNALVGRTALITGPTSGLGRATAEELARLGARLILVSRSRDKLAALRDDLIATHGEDRFPIVEADMSSLPSVRAAAERIVATEARIDILIDNAGAIFPERRMTDEGIERTFATMVVGPFVLIASLLPLLRHSTDPRIVAVTSGGQYAQALPLDDLQYARGEYAGAKAYARAKRAQVSLVREWARRLGPSGPTINAMHPGWAATPGLSASLPGFAGVMGPVLRSPGEGIDTLVWLATAPEAGGDSGRLYLDRRPRPFDRAPATRLSADERRELWDRVVGLAGGPDPAPDAGGDGHRRP